ncbi:Na+/H+ antiporter NhaA [Pleionea sediminis]|uniref:Na+/H+ antiporter NhaA n=1 Tax=Pleionea sediminis TaxID=2569479 RepID=UPI001184C07E|nr:Na+/H+ antiporter NhaA [Pleionea sediminis]
MQVIDEFKRFLKLESASGIILLFSAILALIFANTGLYEFYQKLIQLPVEIRVGDFQIDKPLLLWINDGLMAIFFLLVGLELKREFREGELSSIDKVILPGLGAIGGMVVPALIYAYFNWSDPVALKGWAIPAATDIAFALGILMLLGKSVPVSLKVFLVALAIFDDIGAIVIIALFYTSNLSMTALVTAIIAAAFLFALNRKKVSDITPYFIVGIIMWAALLKSGVHATLAGVVMAMFIPMKHKNEPNVSPLKDLEHDLHGMVAFFVLPVFAFANAGVPIINVGLENLLHPISLGIFCGLVFGKQIGIMLFIGLGMMFKITKLPKDLTILHIYGASLLCGIGFTMSLFIGGLAFEETGVNSLYDERLGILAGSLVSGILGYIVLKYSLKKSTS